MRRIDGRARLASLFVLGILMASLLGASLPAEDRVYELRTYVTNEGKLDALHQRFRDHTTGFFEKHGMQNHAYWVPLEGAESENTLVYIISHDNREAAAQSWESFRGDPEWQAAAAASEKDGKILAQPPESIYMVPTEFSPQNWEAGEEPRIFQLRRYTTVEGRLPALLKRFRNGEMALFKKHGFTNIAYFTPLEIPDTLIYVVAHEDQAAMKSAWESFRNDPEWQQLWESSSKDGKIVIKVDRQTLRPVDYSKLK